jgi:hypothetical protein
MGLPLWTFVGVGVAAILFNELGGLFERGLRDLFRIDEKTTGALTYVPQLLVFTIPVLVVVASLIIHQVRHRAVSIKHHDSGALSQPEGKKGLIVLVSNADSAEFAIKYHYKEKRKLEAVWLVPSNDLELERFGSSSLAVAEEIELRCKKLREEGRPLEVHIHRPGVSPADSQTTFDYVNHLFRKSPYEADEIIADFTGGTKPMSVGMIMACLPRDRELEYISYNQETKQSHGPFLVDYEHRAFDLIG